MRAPQKKVEIRNKKASFEYFLDEVFEAGIVLTGTEIKSVRNAKASVSEAYCAFQDGELYVKNMHIAEYEFGTYSNHDPKRDRKLLLNFRELKKLSTKTKERGYTIIPVMLFLNEKGLAKLNIALARGKKLYDKRETIKTKDLIREQDRREY